MAIKKDWMQSLAEAIANAFRSLFGIGRRAVAGTARFGLRAATVVGAGVVGVAEAAIGLPVNVLRAVAGTRQSPPNEGQVAADAAAENANGKTAADATVRETSVAGDIRRAVRRLAKGRELPADLLVRVPADTLAYLKKLTPSELQVLAATTLPLLVAHLAGQRETEGVRSVAAVTKLARPMMADAARHRTPADGPYAGPGTPDPRPDAEIKAVKPSKAA